MTQEIHDPAEHPAERLPVLLAGTQSPFWWAMVLFLLIEVASFGALISSYFYLRFRHPIWPPEGIAPPDLLLGAAAGAALLASSAAYRWADLGIRKGDPRRLQVGLGIAIVLALAALGLQLTERVLVDYRWDTNAYGSIVWATLLFHGMHVLVLALTAVLLEVLAVQGYFTADRRLGVQVIGLLWHFVALMWIPVFVVLFLVPRYW